MGQRNAAFNEKLLALLFLFSALALPWIHVHGASPDSKVGTIRGQVGIGRKDGTLVPAQSAEAHILFHQAMQENGSFAHTNLTDSAGTKFQIGQEKALGKVKANLKEIERNNPREQWAGKIAEYYLKSLDEGLAAAKEWVTTHPDRGWQIRTATPDKQGLWNVNDLKPGTYDIVVRGQLEGREACWEATVDLRPGQTISLPLDRPRFFTQ